ncbi:T-lymphocyte surface antigen Ly-9-like [Mobula hypostoma]|uniref:T-lymphocyte surface antigen Ly-9-like n=1 Tax=Mobula hypostoma TaxID=723540 RepID=UPI002FC3DC6F
MGKCWNHPNCALVFAIFLARTGASPVIVNGVLGHSVSLSPSTPVCQGIDAVVWKRLSLSAAIARYIEGSTKYFNTTYNNRITLHSGNFSLEIHDLRKEDTDDYEVTLTAGDSGKECKKRIQLKVYEPVSGAHITVQSTTGICNFTLTCSVTSGDPISFTWWRNETLVNDSTQHFQVLGNTLKVHHAAEVEDIVYCEVRNPISNETAEIKLRDICKLDTSDYISSNNNAILVISLCFIAVICALGFFGVKKFFNRRRSTTEGSRPEDPGHLTIYAEVQGTNRSATNRQPPEGNETVHRQEERKEDSLTLYDTVKAPGPLK